MADQKAKKPSGDKAKKPTADKAKKPTSDKPKKKEKAATEAPVAEAKAPEPERKPADPRLKYMKKFKGRFLPKGPLRDRHKQIVDRWNAGEDHGGVTLDEVKSLFEDWRATRQKPAAGAAKV